MRRAVVLLFLATVACRRPAVSEVDPSVYAKSPAPTAPSGAALPRESPQAPPPREPTRSSPSFEPVVASPQGGAYALIVALESYRSLPSPTGARADAERVEAMMRKTFGLPHDRIRVLTDAQATRSDVFAGIDWIKRSARAGGRVYFYFSGHGTPDPSSGVAYLLPYESSADNLLESGMKLDDVLGALAESKARDVIAMIDSCFSGTGDRSLLRPGTRALTRVREPEVRAQVVLLSASRADETSGPSSDEKVGAFTRFVTEGLGKGAADLNGDGQISAQELIDWVGPRVTRDALGQNRRQTPQLSLGSAAGRPSDVIVGYGYR